MTTEALKQIIIDQKTTFNRECNLIERDIDLSSYLKTKQIVVITGVRRCGKSSLLYLIKQKLKLEENEYCYFNFDDERILRDTEILQQIYLLHLEIYKKEPVFFFDEIQDIPQWEKFINRIYEKGLKVYVTGSNATMLSSEIASSLTGRNKTIALYPFSFAEYLRFINKSYDIALPSSETITLLQSHLNDYVQYGGFPIVINEQDLEIINNYFQDILYRDIIARYRIAQVNELKQIALYLLSNTGKLYSYATLQKISGAKSTNSIKSYLGYFEQSYLFFYIKKFDYSFKKQLLNSRKVYSIDQGFCNKLGFKFSEDKGRILENVIYVQLLRLGKTVFYHLNKSECDFIIQEGLKLKQAIQVVYEFNHLNAERELAGLTEAMADYKLSEGFIIAGYVHPLKSKLPKGVSVIPAWKWLLQNT